MKYERIPGAKPGQSPAQVGLREYNIAYCRRVGYTQTAKEIARRFGVSKRTVERYRKEIRCSSTT